MSRLDIGGLLSLVSRALSQEALHDASAPGDTTKTRGIFAYVNKQKRKFGTNKYER